ncbi:hypothetical protein J28TS4_04980 [Paenibacillus lautus]|uniref:hypothetical protein n=1 Tax=Paenibacillus lautus TaxID=1401 RepID=UPI001B2AF593|nr:hypothetical protein [Paenibacillus lautus]GIP02091.1 hypothetical protein J28TS4_04980 [Paenibacillus lautus]
MNGEKVQIIQEHDASGYVKPHYFLRSDKEGMRELVRTVLGEYTYTIEKVAGSWQTIGRSLGNNRVIVVSWDIE